MADIRSDHDLSNRFQALRHASDIEGQWKQLQQAVLESVSMKNSREMGLCGRQEAGKIKI